MGKSGSKYCKSGQSDHTPVSDRNHKKKDARRDRKRMSGRERHRSGSSSSSFGSCPSDDDKTKKKPFETYYSDSRPKEEEKRQYESWKPDMGPPIGHFIDIRDAHTKDFAFESSARIDASHWVCIICFPGGTGTGFRVGANYIMTAKHVVDFILNSSHQQIGSAAQTAHSRLQGTDVCAVFDFTIEGQQISDRQKFGFKGIVHFSDSSTDTAVLELVDNARGTAMPPPFTLFSLPKLNDMFTLIGHSEGKRLQLNHVDKIIDMNSAETQRYIERVQRASQQHVGRDYGFSPHNILTNQHRFLFHCKLSKGGSGSPGVVILHDESVVVVTMLVCGLPDWYYDPSLSVDLKNSWPKNNCVEQGANFKYVYEHMFRDNPNLCHEIFSSHTDTIPNPTI